MVDFISCVLYLIKMIENEIEECLDILPEVMCESKVWKVFLVLVVVDTNFLIYPWHGHKL